MEIAQLGIRVENGQVIKATAALEGMAVAGAKTEAATGRVSRRMGLAEIEARKMDAAMTAAGRSSFRLTGGLGGLTGALQAVAGALAIRQLVALTDEYTNLRNKLGQVTTGAENLAAVEARLLQVSQDTRTGLEGNVALYASLARSTKALGLSQQDLVDITATVSGALITGGASASEANSSIRQLSQAFASGVLRGDEFNSMAENAPRLQQLLADSLGVSIGQLRAMAEAGELTSERLAKAFLEGTGTVRGEVEAMGLSISQAMTQIKNAVLVYVGSADQANGASRSIADGLSMFADKVPAILGWIGKLAQAYGFLAIVMATVAEAAKNIATGNGGLNSSLLANLKSEWEALMTAPTVVASGGALNAGGAASGAIPIDAKAAAKAARDAAREAEALRRAEERAEHDRVIAEQRYLDDVNEIWDRGMADIVASTDRGFRAVLESVSGFIDKLVERTIKEGRSSLGLEIAGMALGGALAGGATGMAIGGMTRSRPLGAMGGAAGGAVAGFMAAGPIGAAAGALTGFIGGILGSGNAAREAAKQMEAFRTSFELSIEAWKAASRGDSMGVAIATIQAQAAEYRRLLEELIPWSARHGTGGDAPEIIAEYNRRLQEINDAEKRHIENLEKQTDAMRNTAAAMLNLTNSYKVQAAVFNAIQPGMGAGPTPPPGSPPPRMTPPPSRSHSRSGSGGSDGDLTVTVVMPSGEVVGKAVLKNFKTKAQAQFGDSTRWGQIQ